MARTPALALHASASYHGRTVEETFSRRGAHVQIGRSEALHVPTPEGWPYIARVRWTSPRQAIVLDHDNAQHLLGPDDLVTLEAGPVRLELRLVRQFRHARWEGLPWRLSLGWFVCVIAATAGVQTVGVGQQVAEAYWCRMLAVVSQSAYEAQCLDSGGNDGGIFAADYLARLLKEDYAGADEGYLEVKKVDAEKKQESFYLPAGDDGPITEMGGAEETAPEPVRTAEEAKAPPPPVIVEEEAAPETVDIGEAVADAAETEEAPQTEHDDAGEDASDTDSEEDREAPAEEEQGWGVQDWYDARDARIDELEVETMLRYSKERLRIDPNDPDALSILSYYQYLAQDFESALKTYDKFIQLYPDASAGYNNKALVYKRLGDYQTEEQLYRMALALDPDDVTALNNLAVNLAHQGRHDEALAIMNRLEVLDPGEPYADLHRSKIHAQAGNDDEAYAFLEKALQGMAKLDTLHHIEFRQDIRVDPSFEKLRQTPKFHAILRRYYDDDAPVRE